jgi:hypothetical protein
MLKIIHASYAALIFAGFAASTPAAAEGRFCGSLVKSGEASGATEDEAKKAATVWWSSRAGALGEGYQFWDNSKDKAVNCHPGPRNTVKCIAEGKPCLPDGVLPQNVPKQDL